MVLLLVLVFTGIIPGLRPRGGEDQRETVVVWGIFDDTQAIQEALGPETPFTYRQLPLERYETELVNALAAGQGPDVFMIHNTWLPKHVDKLYPLVSPTFTITQLRELFPTVIEQDFAPDGGAIYALPLYIDTLAMLYNKEMFDAAAIAIPPKTWTGLEAIIPTLRRLDAQGNIERAAIAVGGSPKSVNRATDLVGAFMLQGGAAMVDSQFGSAVFADEGLDPFLYYVGFANAANTRLYTWNDRLPYSLDAFTEESAAIIFNYAYQVEFLKEKFPFLKMGVASFPQPTNATREVSYANYWGLAVSRTSLNPDDAWNFIAELTANPVHARVYTERTRRPPALRQIIQEYVNDPDLGVFARQALSARSWPQVDNLFVEQVFGAMIEDVLTGRLTPRDSIQRAESAITAKMQERAERFRQ